MESKITGEQGAAIFRLVRSDSCISEDKIINWNEISSCEGEGLSYNVTLTLIDASDNIKAGGVWLSTGPIIIARYGDRKFYSGPDGGGYSNTGVFGKGYSEPSNLYWWELVNITLDGGDWITSL
ncbi:hypothetical protein [Vibrio aestuarianus]|nr:hypothetical protein [Vibrio aestuarianus]MDE1234974.1 hypothetical protein [Vibrio aestuarianus]MDE1245805.1 hypothetical protein [Vibrio aestuarianus]MDE1346810.1 hypothetical protein [Vibrio aestuarianus]NGZ63176.1 hypothetical protein [Vibrio aestuarianus subsp. cardii]